MQGGSRARQVLLLLAATAVTLITLDFRGYGPIGSLRSGLGAVLEPLVSVTDSAFSPVGDLWNGVANYGELEEENAELRARLDEVVGQQVREENASAQLEALTAQLGLDFAAGIETVPARVTTGPVANFDYSLRLDRGSRDGIAPDMPVVGAAGLVGRIAAVTPGGSVVELLDSLDFGVGVRVVGSRDTFVARGQGRGELLAVPGELAADSTLRENASVVTSGLDRSIYPADVPVGRIVEFSTGSGSGVDGVDAPITDVRIEPLADLERQTFVTVLRWTPGGG